MKLSIVIPYYNTKVYTDEILKTLAPQIVDDVEVIVVDDGSHVPYKTDYKWCKVIRKKNGGACTARNLGIERSSGEYIAFIDSDDNVPSYYVDKILNKIKEGDDIIELSWRSLTSGGNQYNVVIRSPKDRLENCAVWCRVFKRSFIGNVRFNEQKDSTEDEDFTRHLRCQDWQTPPEGVKFGFIPDHMYYYRTDVVDSKFKKFKSGMQHTKRIVYCYDEVTADRTDILETIKKDDIQHEVWLLTNKCEIPELELHCRIAKPDRPLFTHYLRGDYPAPRISIIPPAVNTKVVLYVEYADLVCGIATFIYNFCSEFSGKFDMVVVHDRMDQRLVKRLETIVPVYQNSTKLKVMCDTLILNRLSDKIPAGIDYKKIIQLNHACKLNRDIPKRDFNVCVSQAAKDSWGAQATDAMVIHNLVHVEVPPLLFLVSATRIGAQDKGGNDNRFRQLADKLEKSGIPWIWLNFSDKPLTGMPSHFINMAPEVNIQNYIRKATYLVQLSQNESFSYSIVEALTNQVPVICCPMDVLPEIGVEDGKNAHVVPFDMNFDVNILLDVPKFVYNYNNAPIIKQWEKLIKKPKPKKKTPAGMVLVEVAYPYTDTELKQKLDKGTQLYMTKDRAHYLQYDHPYHVVRIIRG